QHRPSLIHIGLQLPVIKCISKPKWNFRKANWSLFMETVEQNIPVDESYKRFCGALYKAAQSSVPRGFHPLYTPCLDGECAALLDEYEKSGDPDIADYLLESLDAARRNHWEDLTSRLNFTHSSRRSWGLIHHLGVAQCPPAQARPSVSVNAIVSHLLKVARAPRNNKDFERRIHIEWRHFRQNVQNQDPPQSFSLTELDSVLCKLKSGTATSYDNVHPEFLKHLGLRARN
uniref:Uncharacterized protein n=1 Tax=Latimeria chalumnae TaxID=7897 RepID=H3ABG0_LATCH